MEALGARGLGTRASPFLCINKSSSPERSLSRPRFFDNKESSLFELNSSLQSLCSETFVPSPCQQPRREVKPDLS